VPKSPYGIFLGSYLKVLGSQILPPPTFRGSSLEKRVPLQQFPTLAAHIQQEILCDLKCLSLIDYLVSD
jgi:hypothetical protein